MWWNSEVEQCWWNSGKVMVKHRGKTVEQCWWNGVVEQCGGTVEQCWWNSDGAKVMVE